MEAAASGLAGYLPEELSRILDLPLFRAKQLFRWISRGAASFESMTDLSLELRERLAKDYLVLTAREDIRLRDRDGTEKIRLRLHSGEALEAALLRDREGRGTACLSTQAGCPMGCVFCKTGTLGLLRNLDAGEMVEQYLHLKYGGGTENAIDNIVIMGMGEPFLNLEALRRALEILMDSRGAGLSKRRITLSTSGIVEGIRDFTDNGPDTRLAVSLATADGALREKLMPVTKANPLPLLKESLLYYQQKRGRRVTLEMVLLGGINTRERDLDALVDFTRGLECLVNIIPWNFVPGLLFEGAPLQEPSPGELSRFLSGLKARGIKATRRTSRGTSIAGACGQLGERTEGS